ncbi:hypothetical protein [Microbulbifer sp. SAOS-129_SWC]|uniref:hypothetical protein n=1 Tax=Microbulbifer sp. SAOS-129_SWC TaxID=3145235 RepID=UPI0032177508
MVVIAFRVLLVLLVGIALYAGLRSQPFPEPVPHFDWMLHCGVFLAMSALCTLGFSRPWQLLGIVLLLAFGAGIELWQGWALPARTASLADMSADTVGVLLGWVIGWRLKRFLVAAGYCTSAGARR